MPNKKVSADGQIFEGVGGGLDGIRVDRDPGDIRDRPWLDHGDVRRLNFIRDHGSYVFRRHYRSGLRSHILEVLYSGDVEREKRGVIRGRDRWFPRAIPVRMLRIFRVRFRDLEEGLEELERVKMITRYLAPDYMAGSEEFLVDYTHGGHRHMILCGLQEYVDGEILDPWGFLEEEGLMALFGRMPRASRGGFDFRLWVSNVKNNIREFITRICGMIMEEGYVPDLAGLGNILVTASAKIKLVDINNISRVFFDSRIRLDDKGYPVCDKSIQVLSILERKLLGGSEVVNEDISGTFLAPERLKAVSKIERRFHLDARE